MGKRSDTSARAGPWTRQLEAIERVLVQGQWRWPGAQQELLRRLLRHLRDRHRAPAWQMALACLERLRRGDRTAAAALVEGTLLQIRLLREERDPLAAAASTGRAPRYRRSIGSALCPPYPLRRIAAAARRGGPRRDPAGPVARQGAIG